MLTPGEFVVNRNTVARLGAGFFETLNNLSAPAQALAGRTPWPACRALPRRFGATHWRKRAATGLE
jgi:hypothetical protein